MLVHFVQSHMVLHASVYYTHSFLYRIVVNVSLKTLLTTLPSHFSVVASKLAVCAAVDFVPAENAIVIIRVASAIDQQKEQRQQNGLKFHFTRITDFAFCFLFHFISFHFQSVCMGSHCLFCNKHKQTSKYKFKDATLWNVYVHLL